MNKKINRILIAGTHSGCGKTTVTCGILRALQKRGLAVRAFKCGPDYIDPMFHSEVIGTKSRNIDMFLCGEETAKDLFAKNSSEEVESISVVEGVMGYYDGLGGNTAVNSTYHIGETFQIPTILVVDGKGASLSVVAMIQGYLNYKENNIVGVILNQVSKAMFPFYRKMIEDETGVTVLGCLQKEPKAMIGSRHLGLITAEEIQDLNEKLDMLGALVEEQIDLDKLLEIGRNAPTFAYSEEKSQDRLDFQGIRLGVAKDPAFCFYYEDGLTTLQELGVKLVEFSPLREEALPDGVDGLILGGGYPELYLEQLSTNQPMIESIRAAHESNMPIYAECGGFMYLGKAIDGWPMTGIIDMQSEMTTRLQNFGYATLTPLQEGTLIREPVNGHEFHYSRSDMDTFAYEAKKSTGKTWKAGYCSENIFAQYTHIHFSGAVDLANEFLRKCEEYQKNRI